MESRSEHSPPEQQAWNTIYFSPHQPGANSAHIDSSVDEPTLESIRSVSSGETMRSKSEYCGKVREQAQELLDDEEATLRPETRAAVFGHMAVCPECMEEFETMRRMVTMLNAMPLAELPTDYSRSIMLQIQAGRSQTRATAVGASNGLCDRVREKLQALLENDPGILPEMATALKGHLMVCPDCNVEFNQLRNMVNLLETMPTAEPPTDYSKLIMQRIQGIVPARATVSAPVSGQKRAVTRDPSYAASSDRLGEAANLTMSLPVAVRLVHPLRRESDLLARRLSAVSLAFMLAFLMDSAWARQMIALNLDTVRGSAVAFANLLGRVPVVGALTAFVAGAFIGLDRAVGTAFATLTQSPALALAVEAAAIVSLLGILSMRTRRTLETV